MSDQFDVVIIGSGLGGMECAYILSKEGFNVCLLEKNRQFGGCLQIFSRDKVIFDTGVHYIGGLDPGQNLYKYFKYFGLMDHLKLRKMDEAGFDRISFDNDPKEYNHAMTYEGFEESLISDFPNEAEGIKMYTAKLQEICNNFDLYNLREGDPDVFDTSYLEDSAKSFIEQCTNNIKLQNVLAGSNPLYAGYADMSPLYMHALVVNTYIESAYKCIDGGGQITMYFKKALKALGCTLKNYAEVTKLHISGGEISEAELSDGSRIRGKKFISNIHPKQTLNLIDPNAIKKSYRRRIQSLDDSISVFTLHIVFKENAFPYLNYNYYHHRSDDVWAGINYTQNTWPDGYAIFVPADSQSEEYASGMNMMTYMRADEVSQWADTFNTVPNKKSQRSSEYQEWKIIKAEKMIDELEKKWPDIRSKIKSYYTSTPLSFRDYIGTTDGALYGIRKDYNNPLRSYISPRTKVPNLFLTGQNLNMHGILGVTVGSVVTTGQFVGTNHIIKKINQAS